MKPPGAPSPTGAPPHCHEDGPLSQQSARELCLRLAVQIASPGEHSRLTVDRAEQLLAFLDGQPKAETPASAKAPLPLYLGFVPGEGGDGAIVLGTAQGDKFTLFPGPGQTNELSSRIARWLAPVPFEEQA